jgi:predicted phage terminase large subunit-like protein
MEALEPIRPQPKQELFLMSQADITIYGGTAGSGKSFSELLAPLINVDDPNFNSIFFRRTRPELTTGGGIWDTSSKIYPRFNAVPNETALKWKFPSGAVVKFAPLQYDKDSHSYQSAAIPLIIFDELPQFTAYQFFYLMSRNRAPTGYKKSCWIMASANAEPGWLANLIAWWWDPKTGYPIPERSGVIRHFIRQGDDIVWVDKDYRDERGNKPKSLTYIYAELDDNAILKKNDPGYEANLLAQDEVTRERLLKANWLITYSGGMFRKEWFKPTKREDLPKGMELIRYWDWAATEVKDGNDPDYTVGALCGMFAGDFYIIDIIRFREAPGTTEKRLLLAAEVDGFDTTIAWEEEKASAGKYNTHYLSGKLQGYKIHADPVSGDKIERAKPLASSAEHGHVYYVVAPWNNDMFIELGQFGSGKGHKDIVDSLTGNHKIHTQVKRVWPMFSISKCIEFKIDFTKPSSNVLHYGAFHQTPDNTLYFIAGLWDKIRGTLFIYSAKKYENIISEEVALSTIKIMNMRMFVVNKLLASDGMITNKNGSAKYINQAIRKFGVAKALSAPVMLDHQGSIVFLNAMFASGVIGVHSDLGEPAAQFAGWAYKDGGKAPVDGFGYCEALCLIASELKVAIAEQAKKRERPDYPEAPETDKPRGKSWQAN